jgi:imidazolonepropionase-like amidohydrolase
MTRGRRRRPRNPAAALRVLSIGLTLAAALSAHAEPLVLRGATLHPITSADVPNGTLVADGGRIVALGTSVPVPAGARVVDVTGLHVYPGLIDANTVLGLVEIGSVRGTVDVSETGDVNPNARVEVALNGDTELFPVARANGVLVAMTAPRGGLVAGTAAVIQLDGWNWEDLTLRAPVGLVVNWPDLDIDYRPEASKSGEDQAKSRDERVRKLRAAFADARAHQRARDAEGRSGVPIHDHDGRWEALAPVLRGEIPVMVAASEVSEIRAALRWAAAEDVRVVFLARGDIGRVADELARQHASVVLDPVWSLPQRRWEPYDTPFTNAARLHAAGVPFCFSTGSGTSGATNARNLPYEAAQAVAHGLPRDIALRALTQTAADILGVGDRVGSLAPGKDATFFVSDGDPLDIRTHVLHAFVAGRESSLETRQTRLRDKYRSRPRPAAATAAAPAEARRTAGRR